MNAPFRTDPEKSDPPAAIPYAQLTQMHPELDLDLWRRLELLYVGGYEMQKRAREFVPAVPGESTERYNWRLKHSSYISYVGQVVGYLAGALFQAGLQVVPAADAGNPGTPGGVPSHDFYAEFAADCDLQGTAFADFLRTVTIDALLHRRAVVVLDMPPAPDVSNRADEERLGGGRAYVAQLPLGNLLDWEQGDDGNLAWCIVKTRVCKRRDVLSSRGTYRERYTLWQLNDGRAVYRVFETRDISDQKPMRAEEPVECVTPATATTFKTLPVKQLVLPEALWIGNKAGPLAEEHFRKRSDLAGAMSRSLLEVPYVKRGPEIPAVHGAISETQSDPHRGADPVGQALDKGWVELGSEDEIGFAGPSGRAFEIAARQCHELRDEIFRSVHAMALSLANTSASVGRSGDSKREDRSATEIVLDALGDDVRRFARELYTCISRARNERIVWVAHGLDKFSNENAAELVEEAPLVMATNIASPTFRREYAKKFAFTVLPKLSAETKQQIGREIDEGTIPEDYMLPHLHLEPEGDE
ncbi:MAG TPA: hypothetical protein VK843_17000 [Planctomycetota bacterium]|nr:hypothetical protein [Planctomycetota bacterium]